MKSRTNNNAKQLNLNELKSQDLNATKLLTLLTFRAPPLYMKLKKLMLFQANQIMTY